MLIEKLAVIGCHGKIGRAFYDHFSPNVVGLGRAELDLCDPQLPQSVESCSWAVIAAGMATPKHCLENPNLMQKCDLEGVVSLAKQLDRRGIFPVVFSTAYVFDGRAQLYTPLSKPCPLNAYGELSAERENRLLAALPSRVLIVRLSRVLAEGSIVHEMIESFLRGEVVKAARDQIVHLIAIEDVILGVLRLRMQKATGIAHLCAQEGVSRYALACYIQEKLEVSKALVQQIDLADIDGIPRPPCVRMTSSIATKSWKTGVDCIVEQYRTRAKALCQDPT